MLSLIHAFCAFLNTFGAIYAVTEQKDIRVIVLNILFAILNAALAVTRYKEGR